MKQSYSLKYVIQHLHPRLSVFLVEMQLCTNETEDMIHELLAQTRAPNPRNAIYQQNDENITTSVQTFNYNTNYLLNPNMPGFQDRFRAEVLQFLNHIQHLLGLD